jgi:SAM-dependent methyltransferase
VTSKQVDRDFLKNEAYDDADDLKIRIELQARYSSNPTPWSRWLLERLTLPDGGKFLDLGSGPGYLWVEYQPLLPDSLSLILSDLSYGMLVETRANLKTTVGKTSFAALDAQALPFPTGVFDGVLGSGLLDHLPDRERGLSEVRRVLKPGGRFCTTCGGQSHLQEIRELVEPFLGEVEYGGDPGRFGLENGPEILSAWFSQVELFRYDDTLVFDQPEPVLLYLFSEAVVRSSLNEDKQRALVESVERRIAQEGEIQVRVEKGLFKVSLF